MFERLCNYVRDDLTATLGVVGLCGVLKRFNACSIIRMKSTPLWNYLGRYSRELLTSSRDVHLGAYIRLVSIGWLYSMTSR